MSFAITSAFNVSSPLACKCVDLQPVENPSKKGSKKVGKKGPKGAKGAKGTTGTKGERGEQGLAGTKGPLGDEGTTGTTGERGEQGLAGTKGPPGDEGNRGPDGIFTGDPTDLSAYGKYYVFWDPDEKSFFYDTQESDLNLLTQAAV